MVMMMTMMMMTMINDDDGGDDNDDDESEETDSSNVGNESAWATVLLTIRMNLKPTTNDISMLDNHRTYPNPTHLYVLQQKKHLKTTFPVPTTKLSRNFRHQIIPESDPLVVFGHFFPLLLGLLHWRTLLRRS